MITEPEFRTRRPSGKPPWPLVLLAGVEKAGKSFAAAQFSSSDLIDRTFWVEVGEGSADQYGALPGARYEIVEHDGTYKSIGRSVWAAINQPRPDGKPHAIVIDSMTELWDLLADEAQNTATKRAQEKAEKQRQRFVGDATITMDLWNRAKKQWQDIIDLLRTHDGPVIMTTRLESVTVMDGDKPTKEKEWKVRAEKNFPFECDAIVRLPAPQKAELVGVRSLNLRVPAEKCLPMPNFSIDDLMRKLGLNGEGSTAPRVYTAPKVGSSTPSPGDGSPAAVAGITKTYSDHVAAIVDAQTLGELDQVKKELVAANGSLDPAQKENLNELWLARRSDVISDTDEDRT